MNYIFSSVTRIGQRRNTNEDSLGVFKNSEGLLIVVCDGLGGNKAGEVASKMTVDAIHNFFNSSKESDLLARIKHSVAEANQVVLQNSSENIDFKGMATTVEVLFLKDHEAYWGHVGDSRIYFLRNGKLKLLTKDHSLVQKLVDEGFLSIKDAENHPNRNIIIRALGDNPAIDVDLSKMKFNLKDDNIFFVCTDGVTTVVNDQELENILQLKNLEQISEKLSHLIEERGAPDNYSFVIISKMN